MTTVIACHANSRPICSNLGFISACNHFVSHSSEVVSVTKGVHYCVTNMPGAGARTSTFALSNVTTSFILALADKGWRRALNDDPHLRNGLNATTAVLPIAPAHDQKDVNFCSVGL
jgi:alanine dehydrogenase